MNTREVEDKRSRRQEKLKTRVDVIVDDSQKIQEWEKRKEHEVIVKEEGKRRRRRRRRRRERRKKEKI